MKKQQKNCQINNYTTGGKFQIRRVAIFDEQKTLAHKPKDAE